VNSPNIEQDMLLNGPTSHIISREVRAKVDSVIVIAAQYCAIIIC